MCEPLHGVILTVGSWEHGSSAQLFLIHFWGWELGCILGGRWGVTHSVALTIGLPVLKEPGCECSGDKPVLRCCHILGFCHVTNISRDIIKELILRKSCVNWAWEPCLQAKFFSYLQNSTSFQVHTCSHLSIVALRYLQMEEWSF